MLSACYKNPVRMLQDSCPRVARIINEHSRIFKNYTLNIKNISKSLVFPDLPIFRSVTRNNSLLITTISLFMRCFCSCLDMVDTDTDNIIAKRTQLLYSITYPINIKNVSFLICLWERSVF